MAGLTRCITVTDLVVRTSDGLSLHEVKSNKARWGKGQRRRLAEVVYQLTVEPSFVAPGGVKHWIVQSQEPLSTHWEEGEAAVARTVDQAVAAWVPNPAVALILVAPFHSPASNRRKTSKPSSRLPGQRSS